MNPRSTTRYIRDGIQEALFTLKTNIFMIVAFTLFVIIYMPLAIDNIASADYLGNVASNVKLSFILPIIITYNILFALLISVIIASAIEQEKTNHVLEYLFIYSNYGIGEFLLIKLLSSLFLGLIIAIPYLLLLYFVISIYINISLYVILLIFISILFSTVSYTYIMVMIVLVLNPRYSTTIKFFIIILVYLLISVIARRMQSPESVLTLNVTLSKLVLPSYIVSAFVLVVSIIIYYIMKDKIVELSLRGG